MTEEDVMALLVAAKQSLSSALVVLDTAISVISQRQEDEQAESRASHPSATLRVIENNLGIETMGQSDN